MINKYSYEIKTKLKEGDPTPGPGNYNIRKEKEIINPSYLFGREKREDEIVKRRKIIPGPGKYEYDDDHIKVHKPNYSFGTQTKGRNYNTLSRRWQTFFRSNSYNFVGFIEFSLNI